MNQDELHRLTPQIARTETVNAFELAPPPLGKVLLPPEPPAVLAVADMFNAPSALLVPAPDTVSLLVPSPHVGPTPPDHEAMLTPDPPQAPPVQLPLALQQVAAMLPVV